MQASEKRRKLESNNTSHLPAAPFTFFCWDEEGEGAMSISAGGWDFTDALRGRGHDELKNV
jgi:hypothetical protein